MVTITRIEVVKEGRDVKQWGGGWLVDLTFNDGQIKRSLNSIDDKMIDNENMVLEAVRLLVNMQIEWQEDYDRLMAIEVAKNEQA